MQSKPTPDMESISPYHPSVKTSTGFLAEEDQYTLDRDTTKKFKRFDSRKLASQTVQLLRKIPK